MNLTTYKKPELIAAQNIFLKNKSVQLKEFLVKESYEKMCRAIEHLQWMPKVEYDMFSYKSAQLPKELLALIQSREFIETVSTVSGIKPKEVTCELRLFGKENYTLLHDEFVQPEGIAFELDFTPVWNEKWGGCTSYTKNEKETASITPAPNTLSLVQQDENTKSFVKYINHLAEKNVRVVVQGCMIKPEKSRKMSSENANCQTWV